MLSFRRLLIDAGLEPERVKLLRHTAKRDIHLTWLNARASFEAYQAHQEARRRKDFDRPYWASFLGLRNGRTLFVGIYQAELQGALDAPFEEPVTGHLLTGAQFDRYRCSRTPLLEELIGRLSVDWGAGALRWSQNAENHEKPIMELLAVAAEPAWPGYLDLILPLSDLAVAPDSWKVRLREGRGVYLLTCPRERLAYVGKADGAGGFLGRWDAYIRNGHGGNRRLMDREQSDYQVSILEVAGTNAGPEDISAMESRWKQKLQSREMGLNAN